MLLNRGGWYTHTLILQLCSEIRDEGPKQVTGIWKVGFEYLCTSLLHL